MSFGQFVVGLSLVDVGIGLLAHNFTFLGMMIVIVSINVGLALLTPPLK